MTTESVGRFCKILSQSHLHTTSQFGLFMNLCAEGSLREALNIVKQQEALINRNSVYCLLQQCESRKDLGFGRQMQEFMVNTGMDSIAVLEDHLIRIFSYHRNLLEANQAFKRIMRPTAVSWAAMILANAKLGDGKCAIQLYYQLQASGTKSDSYIYVAVLKACTMTKALVQGRIIHSEIMKIGLPPQVTVGNTLIDMYVKCGSLDEARNLFDKLPNIDVVSWNAILSGYTQHGAGLLTMGCFTMMQQENTKPDDVTFLSLLKACVMMGAIEHGRLIHSSIIISGFQSNVVVASTLLDMYAKCDSLEEAYKAFDKVPEPDVVAWNALIAGYAQQGECLLALDFFECMQEIGTRPDGVTLLSVLKACANLGATQQGRHLDVQVVNHGFQHNLIVGTALVDMYAKCGSLAEARNIFDKLPTHDLVLWNAMIAGYAQHGEGHLALEVFGRMQQEGFMPDEVSCNIILDACSHAGLFDEGLLYFKVMPGYYGIQPTASHTTCMVDLLSRAGALDEAEDFLLANIQADIMGWIALLSACRVHGNVELGKSCFDQILHTDQHCVAAYILMSNIYADALMQGDVLRVEKMWKLASVTENPWEDMD